MSIMEYVSILLDPLPVIVRKDLLVPDVKRMLMNVNLIHAKMKEAAWMIQEPLDVSVCQVICLNFTDISSILTMFMFTSNKKDSLEHNVKSILTNANQILV